MYEITGKIVFEPINLTNKHIQQSNERIIAMALFDCDIDIYYKYFIEKKYNVKLLRSARKSHITFISDMIKYNPDFNKKQYEIIKNKYNGKNITFKIDNADIRTNEKHYWLKVYNTDDKIKRIRTAIGLKDDYYLGLHLTVGLTNKTEKDLENAKYIHQYMKMYNY